jgi:hypothetical protein
MISRSRCLSAVSCASQKVSNSAALDTALAFALPNRKTAITKKCTA